MAMNATCTSFQLCSKGSISCSIYALSHVLLHLLSALSHVPQHPFNKPVVAWHWLLQLLCWALHCSKQVWSLHAAEQLCCFVWHSVQQPWWEFMAAWHMLLHVWLVVAHLL